MLSFLYFYEIILVIKKEIDERSDGESRFLIRYNVLFFFVNIYLFWVLGKWWIYFVG